MPSSHAQSVQSGSQSAGDWRALYPFCSHHLNLGPANAYKLHHVDEGPGSQTPGSPAPGKDPVQTLLMVHGNPTWSFYWRNLISHWRGRYRVVAPDHLGMGLSDKPKAYTYCLRQHADNLVTLIDALDLTNITLMGHDWGGAIGLLAALDRPERFRSFVLFNTGAFPPPYVPKRIAMCRFPFLGAWAVQALNAFAWPAQVMATNAPGGLPRNVRNGLIAPYDNWNNRVGVASFVRDIPLSRAHRTYAVLEQLEQGLSRIADNPVQLVWGMQDWCFTPVCLKRLQQIFPSAQTHTIHDAGHWVIEDATEEVIQTVDSFLERHEVNAIASP